MGLINALYGKSKLTDFVLRRELDAKLRKNLSRHNSKSETYVIQARSNSGFFSMWFYAIGHLMYAKRGGYKCCIDWQTFPTPYTEPSPIEGISNAWEYYFEQPDDVHVDDLTNESVYFSEDKYPYGAVPYYGITNIGREGVPTAKVVKRVNEFITAYCPIKKELLYKFDTIASEMHLQNCLAVHIRGTDMNFTKGHNRSANIDKIIEKIKAALAETELERVFLCTDEEAIIERIKNEFGSKVIYLDTYRSLDGKQGIHLEENKLDVRRNHKYKMGMEVLRDAYLMSKCKAIVCGKSNVAYAAIVFNGNMFSRIIYTN